MSSLWQTVRRLSRRPEARHVGILTSGSVVAQVVLLATTPLLSRLYPPASFGILAALMTVSTIGGSIGGLCYEVAIIIPRSRRAAQALYRLSLVFSVLSAFLVMGLTWLVEITFPKALDAALTSTFYIVCFFTTIFTTQFNILSYAHSRALQYGAVAVSKFNQSFMPAVGQIAFAWLGEAGLLIGRAAGMLGSVLWLVRGLPEGYRLRDLRDMRAKPLVAVARIYRDFLIQVPRQLLVRSASMLPSALLLGAYGPVAAGLYFFAARLVERPGMFLGDALSRVPMKQFADRRMRGDTLTRAALLYTLAVGTPVILAVALLAAVAHPLFPFVFGKEWGPAADYAVVLAGWAAIRLVSLPMATLTTVLRIQRMSFYLDAIFAGRVFVIPLLAANGAPALMAIAAFCALSVLYHLSTFVLGLVSALRYDRALRQTRELRESNEKAGLAYGQYSDAI